MHVEPRPPQFLLENTSREFRVIVPASKRWFTIFFLSLWLCGWLFGEVAGIRQLLSPSAKTSILFLVAWLGFWTLGGVFALGMLIWQFGGREVISIDGVTLQHRLEAFGVGRTWAYRSSDVKNLRVTEGPFSPFAGHAVWFPPATGRGIGSIAFDYGAQMIRLAPTLEEAEAKHLVAELSSRIPRKLVD